MSHNTFGHLFRVTTWGESHGPAIGCVVDGCPPRLALTEAGQAAFLRADEIFQIGQRIADDVRQAATTPVQRLAVGLVDGISKLAAHVLLCLCRCKVNAEVYGAGYPEAVAARVAALRDERGVQQAASYLSMLGLKK